jgi:predicted peptidase
VDEETTRYFSLMFEEFHCFEFTGTANLPMPYRLFVPDKLKEKLPLVLFFHGAGERGKDNEKQLIHGVAKFATLDEQSKYRCFVLAPQCPTDLDGQTMMWTGDDRDRKQFFNLAPQPAIPLRTALELLTTITQKFPIDMDRIYVTGLSMGGFATWEALIRYPQIFAAGIPVCGGGDKRYADRIKDIPVWAFHGKNDKAVPVDCSRSMIEMMRKAGGHPRYSEYRGIGHTSWIQAYAEPELLSWLFAQKKTSRNL